MPSPEFKRGLQQFLKRKQMTSVVQLGCCDQQEPSGAEGGLGVEGVGSGREPQGLQARCSANQLAQLVDAAEKFCHKYLLGSAGAAERVLRRLEEWGCELYPASFRESVAAVVYCQYSELIRLRAKDFAFMNQLSPKTFNKKYSALQTFLKRQAYERALRSSNPLALDQGTPSQPTQPHHRKQQQTEDAVKLQDVKEPDRVEGERWERRPATARQAIELIFDGIFKATYFQSQRRELIDKLGERCGEIDPRVFREMDWTQDHAVRLYYAIYAHLRRLGITIGFTKYRETVAAFTGIHLKLTFSFATERIFKRIDDISDTDSDSPSSSSFLRLKIL